MTVLLGVDLGERRIGLAVAEEGSWRARPLATVRRGPDPTVDAAAIRRALGGLVVVELVVGLPLDMRDGGEGPQAASTRAWGEAAAAALGLPLTLRDERLSSHLAEQRLGRMTRGRSGGPPTPHQREAYRGKVDREAAAIILEDELESRSAGRSAVLELESDPAEARSQAEPASRKEQA